MTDETLDDPVVIPGSGHANLAVARNDTVPIIFSFAVRNLDGSLTDTSIVGDNFELLIEWENNVLRLKTPADMVVSSPRLTWTPTAAQTDQIPTTCAAYRLIRVQPSERRTVLFGTIQVL